MDSLHILKQQMLTCEACDLCKSRTQVVFGEGSEKPIIMIVGEAPGEAEDEQGKPFVGAAGGKLNKILNYVGVKREDIYICNSVLCRPPSNRNPKKEELDACRWRLMLQIKLLKPKLIVALGRIAVQQLKGETFNGPLNQFFDKTFTYKIDDFETKLIISYHPSFLLRSPIKGYQTTYPHWKKIKKWLEHENKTRKFSGHV